MSDFTPGDWRVDGKLKITVNAHDPRHSQGFVTLCACPGGSDYTTLAETQANARLMAAAPKLLKRLEDNLQFLIAWRYEYAGKPNDAHNNEQRDRIDAAYKGTVALIAEARGQVEP